MPDLINSDIIKFIYAFGIGQAVLLTVLLLRRKANVISNRFLSAIFLLCAIELTNGLYYLGEYHLTYPQFIGITNGSAYLFGPLFYFYIYFLEGKTKPEIIKTGIHFIPFVIAYIFYIIPLFDASPVEKFQFLESKFAFNTSTKILGFLAPFSSIIYISFVLFEIKKIINSLKYNYSTVEFVNLYWLKYFFYGILIQALIVVLLHIYEASFNTDIHHLMLLTVAIFMISSGYVSLKQPEVKELVIEPNKSSDGKKEYKNPSIKSDDVSNLVNQVTDILQTEKPFLNPKLSLKDLSELTNISTHNLTELFNTQMNKSFYELINSYRVEEVKKLIREDSDKKFSLLALAFEAGFSSKTSFNTIFKKSVGKTPSQFRDEIN